MTGLLCPPSGSGNLARRKMVRYFLWFIISGLFTDANSVLAAKEDDRAIKNSSNYSTKNIVKNPGIAVEDDNASSLLAEEVSHHIYRREDRSVPPRSEKSEVEKDYLKAISNDETSGYVRKIPVNKYDLHPSHNTLIPRLHLIFTKYGLTVAPNQHGVRLKVVSPKKSLKSTSDNNEVYDYSNLYQKLESETLDDSGTLIPYSRQARSYDEGSQQLAVYNPATKRESSDYVLPQIRYGRSVTLLSTSKTEKSSTEKPHTFVLPYPRPGRSAKMILLYPKQGLSNKIENSEKSFNSMNKDKRKNDAVSSARLDNLVEDGDNRQNLEKILSSKGSFLVLNSPSQKLKDFDDSSLFVIPYPRPGKKSQSKLEYPAKLSSDIKSKIVTDYVLPYPRPGKRFVTDISEENLKNIKPNVLGYSAQNLVKSYPRSGSSEKTFLKTDSVNEINQMMENGGKDDKVLWDLREIYADKTLENDSNLSESPENNFISSDYELDSIYDNALSDDLDDNSFYFPLNKEEIYLSEEGTGYDSFGDFSKDNDNSGLRVKRSISVVPYPRLGRSKSSITYPRADRSDSVVPYPRLGRSNSVVPYPRLGRSVQDSNVIDSVLLYPRVGRYDSVVPYPRPGRSNSVVPNPLSGQSDSVIPYPRPGRSGSVVPYPRPGRSDSVVPYPRPGRSDSVVPYPRPGRSDSVVPYPRLGRSDSVVPYPRPGRSDSVLPYPRPGRSDSVVPYPRPGRSDSVVPYPRLGRSKSVIPYTSSSDTVLPYPRPGRSNSFVTYSRFHRSNSDFPSFQGYHYNFFSPYLESEWARKGKHHMTFQRPGKYSQQEENYILPYPRLGRHSEQEEKYILPYPRPGRSIIRKMAEKNIPTLYLRSRKSRRSNVLPNQLTSVSEMETFNESGTSNTETVIPYPRLGRSQSEVPLSTDISNSVHKLNKHMLPRADDSIYVLPYPRPGRHAK